MRVKISLECTECKERNYNSTKNKQTMKEKFEIKKYCSRCRKHTVHKEGK